MLSMWEFQLRWQSKVIPRYLALSWGLRLTPCMLYVNSRRLNLFEIRRSWHLSGWNSTFILPLPFFEASRYFCRARELEVSEIVRYSRMSLAKRRILVPGESGTRRGTLYFYEDQRHSFLCGTRVTLFLRGPATLGCNWRPMILKKYSNKVYLNIALEFEKRCFTSYSWGQNKRDVALDFPAHFYRQVSLIWHRLA